MAETSAIWNEFCAAEQAANATKEGADHAIIYKALADRHGISIQEIHEIIHVRTTGLGAG